MLVVFGLGNPGLKYEGTRHNVGVETLQKMAAYYQVKLKRRCFSSYEEVVVTIKYADGATRADGDFSVAFGDITLTYGSVD